VEAGSSVAAPVKPSAYSLPKYFFPAVSTRTMSPLAINNGTMIWRPVSSFASFHDVVDPVPGELTILVFEDEANALVLVLFGLQTAHDRLMDRAVKGRVELILCAFEAGTIYPSRRRRCSAWPPALSTSCYLGSQDEPASEK